MVEKNKLPDRERVIKGLECCTSGRGAQCCYGCPYIYLPEGAGADYDGCNQLLLDALALIKETKNERAGA